MFGGKIALVMGLIILTMGGIGIWYYQDSQATISTLNKNNGKLEQDLELSEKAVDSLERDIDSSNEQITTLNNTLADTRSQNNELAERLEKHNLGILAKRKPGLVERVINNASEKAGRCFELLSGAELTEQEKNATSARTANSECPWLFKEPVDESN
jgi:septal ring factor EnvC (AmiA/AmiB activator)